MAAKKGAAKSLKETEEEYHVPTGIDMFTEPTDEGKIISVAIVDRKDKEGNILYQKDEKAQKQIVMEVEFPWNTAPGAKSPTNLMKLNIPEKRTTDSLMYRWLQGLKKAGIARFDSWQELVGYTFEFGKCDVDFGSFTYQNFRYPVSIISEPEE